MIDINNLSRFEIPKYEMNTTEYPSFINYTISDSENLINGAYVLEALDTAVKDAESISNRSTRKFSLTCHCTPEQSVDKNIKKICKLIKTIDFLTNINKYVIQWLSEINLFMIWIMNKINSAAFSIENKTIQYVLKKIQLLSLHIKKFIIDTKLKVARYIKKILAGVKDGKGSWMATAICAPIQGMMLAFKSLSTVSYHLLVAVDTIIKSIPSNLQLLAQGMSFFGTPRSLALGKQKADIAIANINISNLNRIPNEMHLSLDSMFDETKIKNNNTTVAVIAACAAAGAASCYSDFSFEIPKALCKALSVFDPVKIYKKIDKILDAFATPQALPKYEKLKMTNIGYLSFLITGFCPSGHIAFGFPNTP